MASRSQRKELVTEHRRKQILDAALAVFSRKGYGQATIPDIAREGGMAVGTIYNYYPSKREILVSILATRVLSQPFLKLMEQSPEVDDKAFFRALVQDRLTMLSQNADKFLFMVGEVYRDQDLRRQWAQEVVQPALGRAEKRVASRIDAGAFRPMKAECHGAGTGGDGHWLRRSGYDRGRREPLPGHSYRGTGGAIGGHCLDGRQGEGG